MSYFPMGFSTMLPSTISYFTIPFVVFQALCRDLCVCGKHTFPDPKSLTYTQLCHNVRDVSVEISSIAGSSILSTARSSVKECASFAASTFFDSVLRLTCWKPRIQSCKIFSSLKLGTGQNIALHALLAAKNSACLPFTFIQHLSQSFLNFVQGWPRAFDRMLK